MAGEMNNTNTFRTNSATINTPHGDKLIYPFGPPIFQSEVHTNFVADLLKEGKKLTIEKDDWRHKLAGQMKYGGSYIYDKDFTSKSEKYLLNYVERFLTQLTDSFGDGVVNRLLKKDPVGVDSEPEYGKLVLDTIWINYQHKHDFNPIHTHTGKLSFVIFCEVPKEIFEEQAVSNTKNAGEIIFHYGEHFELTGQQFPVTPYKNLLFIFPANLQHTVPPFWVDAERISVSGNFVAV